MSFTKIKKSIHLLLLLIITFALTTSTWAGKNSVYNPRVKKGRYILTPPAAQTPLINGPSIFGVRPGSPFLYTVPVSGEKPIIYGAKGLPKGLTINSKNGQITGTIAEKTKRDHVVTLTAANKHGQDQKKFTIKVGELICLTPPLGWNSWNSWRNKVDQQKVLDSAKAMVDKGLIDYGWTYINIDDTWQGVRGGKYNAIMPNKKFPDMKAMCDKVHDMGLKVGLYSTPWITSYAKHVGGTSDNEKGTWTEKDIPGGKRLGKFFFDENDVTQWVEWGFDYLKYDWRPNDEPSTDRMANAIQNGKRDIVYSLSNFAPLDKAHVYFKKVNVYRTTGDLRDVWDEKAKGPGRFQGICDIFRFHENWAQYSAPGHHPDPDMLVVGHVGWKGAPKPSRLTPDQQYSHISLWALWAAPLLIGCPIERIDDFTFNLLCNREVLAVNQDPLCVMGKTVIKSKKITYVIVKPLVDGSIAVGMFNLNSLSLPVKASWKDLGIKGAYKVRDLWRQKDIGVFENSFSAMVREDGFVLVKMTPVSSIK
jgi:alpha-galactosidase